MPSHWPEPRRRVLLTLIGVALLFFVFQKNFLRFAGGHFYSGFQLDSQALVEGGMAADKLGLPKGGFHLGLVMNKGETKQADTLGQTYGALPEGVHEPRFEPYKSQFGVQGWFYSAVGRLLHADSTERLQYISCASLAVLMAAFFWLYRSIYSFRFALIFVVSLASSPWLIAFARNLYWAPVLWFLPAFFAGLLYTSTSRWTRLAMHAAIFMAVFLKSLAGYEYLSSMTIFTCSVFVIAPLFAQPRTPHARPRWTTAAIVFGACVGGFALALVIHASIRGDSLMTGLRAIYEEDVKRRTYGDTSAFPEVYKASLDANPLSVVWTYITQWRTPLALWIPGRIFPFLLGFSILGLVYKFLTRQANFKRDATLLGFMLLAPLSWFVLVKGHSYIHTHINFVLWYFGFIPALLFVSWNCAMIFWARIRGDRHTIDSKDY